MIAINGQELNKKQFPDGTYLFRCEPGEDIRIQWRYESDEELFALHCVARHLREAGARHLVLEMPYLPNARMDRVKSADEVFTLKYFAEWINALRFDAVEVTDVHSDVGRALIDRIVAIPPKHALETVLERIGRERLVLYFPDEGAQKRYADLLSGLPFCYGRKRRDWKTGKILELEIVDGSCNAGSGSLGAAVDGTSGDRHLEGATVLMVDDICSYGGTFFFSAQALKRAGAKQIYSYATHTEASLLSEKSKYLPMLESGEVEKHFTTDSLVRPEHDRIEVVPNRGRVERGGE